MKRFTECLLLITLFVGLHAGLRAQTYVFAQLQGSPTLNATGWNLTGAAYVGDTPGDNDGFSDELVLTNPIGTSSGGVFFSQPLNLTQCQKWTAEFEFRMFDGNGADGIALCFLDVPPAGFVNGGGVGIPATANGLKVVFDTYNNVSGTDADPKIEIRYGAGYHEYFSPFDTQPTLANTGGSLAFLRSTNYQSAKVTYDNGNITVSVNGTVYLTGTYLINFSGYLGFTSSTGGSNDRHSIRNVTIYTEQAPSDAGPNAGVAYCSGGSVQIGTTPNANHVYSWSPATGLSQTNVANPTVSLTNTGNAPITQTYTVTTTLAANPGVCPTTDNIVVTVNPVPTSTFTVSDDTACTNEAITITYTGNMAPAATYTWNFDGGTIVSGSGQGPYQVSWPATGTHTVTLTVARYGCTSTVTSQPIMVYAIPTSTFTPPTRLCEGDDSTFVYTGTGSPTATYNWGFDGGTVVSGSGQGPYQVSWATPGLKNLSLTVTENGCVSPASADTIRVYPYPTAGLNVPAAMCGQDTVFIQYDGTPLPGPTSAWFMFTDWSGGSYIFDPTNPGVQFSWTTALPGEYVFANQVTIYGCASDTNFDTLTVHAVPTAAFTVTPEACIGGNVLLTYTGTGGAGATYNWGTAPGTIQSGTGQGPLILTYSAAGNYTVDLVVTENNCVSDTVTAPVLIHPIPTSTFSLPAGICEGQTATLTYTGTGSAGATYDWNFSGTEVVSGSGQGPYVLGDGNLGTFPISLQVTENNCVSTVSSQNFIVLPTPTAGFTGSPLVGCNPLPVQFTNLTPTQPGMVYQWSFGTGDSSTQENPLYVYANAGSYTVNLTATNGFGCADTVTFANYVNVTPQPVAGFTLVPAKITMDDPTLHIVDNSLHAETWHYSTGDGSSYSIRSPYHTYSVTGEYEVIQIVSNSLGCSDTAVHLIEVIPNTNVFLPNAFTPNADGVNDTWSAIISYITEFDLAIFDRWGQEVFSTDNVYEGWNGKYRNEGRLMKGDVYVYRIRFTELSGKTQDLRGHVLLLR